MFHGIFLVLERLKIGQIFLDFMPKIMQNFYAIFVVMIGWVFFRSPDLTHSIGFLKTMFLGNEIAAISNDVARLMRSHFIWMSFVLALLGFSPLIKKLVQKFSKNRIFMWSFDAFLIVVLLFSLTRLSAATHNPFIYFQF
jgi:alginate O-acetyltransferase complex protein AlgI